MPEYNSALIAKITYSSKRLKDIYKMQWHYKRSYILCLAKLYNFDCAM